MAVPHRQALENVIREVQEQLDSLNERMGRLRHCLYNHDPENSNADLHAFGEAQQVLDELCQVLVLRVQSFQPLGSSTIPICHTHLP